MPPAPRGDSISYGPSDVPGESGVAELLVPTLPFSLELGGLGLLLGTLQARGQGLLTALCSVGITLFPSVGLYSLLNRHALTSTQ